MNIVESSVEKGCISKPYIGINVQDVSAETQQYRIPDARLFCKGAMWSPPWMARQ